MFNSSNRAFENEKERNQCRRKESQSRWSLAWKKDRVRQMTRDPQRDSHRNHHWPDTDTLRVSSLAQFNVQPLGHQTLFSCNPRTRHSRPSDPTAVVCPTTLGGLFHSDGHVTDLQLQLRVGIPVIRLVVLLTGLRIVALLLIAHIRDVCTLQRHTLC